VPDILLLVAAVLPRAAIVGQAMVLLLLADELVSWFGGDSMGDLRAATARRRTEQGSQG
jgi:hypothetical protein